MKFKYNIYNRIIIPILLISYISAKEKITEIQKIKGRVCLSLQSRKYQEEKEPMTNWIEHLSKEFNIEPKQVLFMCLSMCYKLISDKLARRIHNNLGDFKLDPNDKELMKIYDYEYYDYDNVEFIKKAYKEFQPIFNYIKDEVQMQGRNFFESFKFEMTPLLKFFLLYFIGNTFIIFYKRIKNPPIINKVIGKDNDISSKKDDDNDNKKNKDNKEHKSAKNKKKID
jgi:hypothetical protein